MVEEKCKVCGHPLSVADTFCPECGFERHVLPIPVSKEVEEYENNRIRNYKEQLELHRQNLEKTEKKVALLTDENTKLEEGQKELEQLLEREKQRAQQLEIDLNDVQVKSAAVKGEKPKAFLLVKDDKKESVGAVYEGRNTYGCFLGGITNNNHQELNIEGLKPLHFSIEAVGDYFRLFDLVGNIKSGRNPISDSGVSLRNGGKLEIGNNIKITFIITT